MFLTDDAEAAKKVGKWSTQSREPASWYQHEDLGYNYRMSNVIAGVVRGQLPHLEEHIAQKKAIFERFREGFKDLPVTMNPFDPAVCVPNHWLSCLLIDEDAMCEQVRTDHEAQYIEENGKSCPTQILEELAKINAEGRPIWKPMHMQPLYKSCGFVTKDGLCEKDENGEDLKPSVVCDIFRRGLCLPSDNKITPEQQDVMIEVVKRCFA